MVSSSENGGTARGWQIVSGDTILGNLDMSRSCSLRVIKLGFFELVSVFLPYYQQWALPQISLEVNIVPKGITLKNRKNLNKS